MEWWSGERHHVSALDVEEILHGAGIGISRRVFVSGVIASGSVNAYGDSIRRQGKVKN
jgi:hypothetical protein